MLFAIGAALAFQVPTRLAPVNNRVRPVVGYAGNAWTESATGLRFAEEKVGSGEEAVEGCAVKFHYSSRVVDGQELDSSKGLTPTGKQRRAIELELGSNAVNVLPGWEEGIQGMRAGGTRKLNIPPSLWSSAGEMVGVPKDATLEFDIELLECKKLTIVDKIGQRRLILGGLIALIGVYEYVSGTFSN